MNIVITCDIYSAQVDTGGPAASCSDVKNIEDILNTIDSIEMERAMLDLYIDIFELNEKYDTWECTTFSIQGSFDRQKMKKFSRMIWDGPISEMVQEENM